MSIKEQFRVFPQEIKEIGKIVRHAKTLELRKKYDSKSHFYRVAVLRLIKEELRTLEVKPGRPRKW